MALHPHIVERLEISCLQDWTFWSRPRFRKHKLVNIVDEEQQGLCG